MTEQETTMTDETDNQVIEIDQVSQIGTGESNGSDVRNRTSDEEGQIDAPVSDATPDDGNRGPEAHDSTEPEVFPAKVVKDLRKENARYRERAQQADDLAHRLHTSLVAATGKLADPTDLGFDEAHLEDPETLAAAVDELLTRKPHLRARRVAGDVGQGTRGKAGGGPDLLEAMRGTL